MSLVTVLATGLSLLPQADDLGSADLDHARVFRHVKIEHPAPRPGARFGTQTVALDIDGDGQLELAVGAPGEGLVYVFDDLDQPGAHTLHSVWSPGGSEALALPASASPDGFGYALAAGDLDGDGDDELVVGEPETSFPLQDAGRAYVLGLASQGSGALLLALPAQVDARVGFAVAVGDFDDDGENDVAVSAPGTHAGAVDSGRVYIVHGPVDAEPGSISVLDNPESVENGHFGHALAVADRREAGKSDLVVSAIGNRGAADVKLAGQVFVYEAPVDGAVYDALEDPDVQAGDPPRFGMFISARGPLITVGAPRKDSAAGVDTGLGWAFSDGSQASGVAFTTPNSAAYDISGYRAFAADLVGDARPDLLVARLSASNARSTFIWDGADPLAPVAQLAPPRDSGSHYLMGLCAAQFRPGGKEELVFGDPYYDRPGAPDNSDNVGRCVIQY